MGSFEESLRVLYAVIIHAVFTWRPLEGKEEIKINEKGATLVKQAVMQTARGLKARSMLAYAAILGRFQRSINKYIIQ